MKIAVLLTCHNRRQSTLICLAALQGQCDAVVSLKPYVFDDGSTDGTAEAVQATFPQTTLLRGDGSYFWNRGMHAAFTEALRDGHDAYLWLNDDTFLEPDAIQTLLRSAERARTRWGHEAVVVGAIRDPATGVPTYGAGQRPSPRWRPFKQHLLSPNGTVQPADLMNGNCVLIPHSVASRIGNLDPTFEHAMGDTDYALRVRAAGLPVVLSDRFVGACARNPVKGTVNDLALGWRARLRVGLSRKGLPPASWFHLCRRHGGPLWLVHFLWAYARIPFGRL